MENDGNPPYIGPMRSHWLVILLLIPAACSHNRPYRTALPTLSVPAPQTAEAVQPAAAAPAAAATAAPQAAEPEPRPALPDSSTRDRMQALIDQIQDVFFDYNQHSLRPDALDTLRSNSSALATILKDYPTFQLTVEGYCDDRGSEEYNLGLGDARATQAKQFLVSLGLPESQIRTVSYGKERPVCTLQNEECWKRNRRAHIAPVR